MRTTACAQLHAAEKAVLSCARRVTYASYGYSIDDVTSWSWVNLATIIEGNRL